MLVTAVAIALVLGSNHAAYAAEPAQNAAMAVSVVHAANRCFTDRVAASGIFVARDTIDIRPYREGLLVSEVLVELGDSVVKDQVLARLTAPKAPTPETVDIKAPVSGLLVGDDAVVGAHASPSAGDPLFRIAAGNEIELKAQTLAANLPRIRIGTTVRIHVVGLGPVDGRVATVGGLDPQTQLASLRISVASDARLHIGTFARAEIDAGKDCGATVPLSAVRFGADGAVVATVQADRVVMRRVTTGLVEEGNIVIRDGLTDDDLVIARAAPFLRDGDHVRPLDTAP